MDFFLKKQYIKVFKLKVVLPFGNIFIKKNIFIIYISSFDFKGKLWLKWT